VFASECLQEPNSNLVKENLQVISPKLERYIRRHKMAYEKGEEEDHPMSHEEIRAMLQSLKETIDELE
jgi:hypothetical protein